MSDLHDAYYWCRTCHHHLTAHLMVTGRPACQGCDYIHSPIWSAMKVIRREPLANSFHEYEPGNNLTQWLHARHPYLLGRALLAAVLVGCFVIWLRFP